MNVFRTPARRLRTGDQLLTDEPAHVADVTWTQDAVYVTTADGRRTYRPTDLVLVRRTSGAR